MSIFEITPSEQQENEEWAAHWCEVDQHDMVHAGEDDTPFYMCVNCGFSANGYITKDFTKGW